METAKTWKNRRDYPGCVSVCVCGGRGMFACLEQVFYLVQVTIIKTCRLFRLSGPPTLFDWQVWVRNDVVAMSCYIDICFSLVCFLSTCFLLLFSFLSLVYIAFLRMRKAFLFLFRRRRCCRCGFVLLIFSAFVPTLSVTFSSLMQVFQ